MIDLTNYVVDLTNYMVDLTIPKTLSKNRPFQEEMGNGGNEIWERGALKGTSLRRLSPSLAHPVSNAPLAPSLLSSTFRVYSLSLFLSLSSLSLSSLSVARPRHRIPSHEIATGLALELQSLLHSSNSSSRILRLLSMLFWYIPFSNFLSALGMDVRFWSVCLEPSLIR
jgi:hypothetical protein